MEIPNRVSAKEMREQADDKFQEELASELTKIYDVIVKHKKDGEVTIYGGASKSAINQLWNDGYIIKESVQTGMNEYSTIIKW